MASTSPRAEVPTPPDFQTDAEEFFKHFDEIQQERDKDLPNPVDDTNALIYQLLQQTIARNESSEIYLPSDTFKPERDDVPEASLIIGFFWGGTIVYLVGGLIYRLVDPFCPYHTPLEVLLRAIWAVTIFLFVACYQLLKWALSSIWIWLGGPAWRIFVDPLKKWGSKLRALQPQRSQEAFYSSESIASQRIGTRSGDITGHIKLQVEPITVERSRSKILSNLWARSLVQPKPREILHAHAIMHVLHASLDPIALYHAASSLCSISDLPSLTLILKDRVSRDRLQDLRDTARRAADRLPKRGTTVDEVQETEKRFVVFETAVLHLYFSSSSGTLGSEANPSHKDRYADIKRDLARLWYSQNDRFGHQPPAFTSTSLAAGVLVGCLDPCTSLFHEESRSLSYRLESASSGYINFWNHLALLALACNTRGGRAMSEDTYDGFRKIQRAYVTFAFQSKEPTDELADAVNQAIRSHVGERTQLPCAIFKLAWKLFVHGRQDGNAARAFGRRVPFLGILEAKIRDDEKPIDYQEYFRGLRSECFEVVLHTVRSISYAERVEDSAPWRFQARFVFRAVDHYAMCIMAEGDALHGDNLAALDFIRSIRALIPPMDPASIDPAQAQSPSEAEYRSEVKTFEETCERFEAFIRSGQ
ncbi:hypothetical protein FRC00_011661, partial [Tulasnella sp. 408]